MKKLFWVLGNQGCSFRSYFLSLSPISAARAKLRLCRAGDAWLKGAQADSATRKECRLIQPLERSAGCFSHKSCAWTALGKLPWVGVMEGLGSEILIVTIFSLNPHAPIVSSCYLRLDLTPNDGPLPLTTTEKCTSMTTNLLTLKRRSSNDQRKMLGPPNFVHTEKARSAEITNRHQMPPSLMFDESGHVVAPRERASAIVPENAVVNFLLLFH